jgi:hypothetical protein
MADIIADIMADITVDITVDNSHLLCIKIHYNFLIQNNQKLIKRSIIDVLLNSGLITYTHTIMLPTASRLGYFASQNYSLFFVYNTSILYPPYTLLYYKVHRTIRIRGRKSLESSKFRLTSRNLAFVSNLLNKKNTY